MSQRSFRRRPHRQRGAVAVLAACALVAMLIATMLAVEVGRIYSAHRELKTLATTAALDAVRIASGCEQDLDSDPATSEEIEGAVGYSLTQNGFSDLVEGALVEVGRIRVSDSDMRELDPVSPSEAQAVRVTLTRPFPRPFLPIFGNTTRVMTATATAERPALGSFYLGSGLLGVNGGVLNGLLSGLLGGNVNLSVLDYQGLAAVGVSLEDLALAVGLEVRDLSDPLALSTESPLLDDVLDGLSASVSDTASPAVAALLRQLGATARSGVANKPVLLGLLLTEVEQNAAAAPFVNLLDLIIGLGAAANADATGAVAPIALPIAVGIPSVTNLRVFLKLVRPPQFSGMRRAGDAEAHTAQLQLQLRLQVSGGLSIPGLVAIDPINLGIDVDVARASAYLNRLQCPRRADPTLAADLSARPSVATVKLGTFTGDPSSAPPILEGAARLVRAQLSLIIGSVNVELFLQRPVSSAVGNVAAIPLDPVTQFTRVEDVNGKAYYLAETSVADNPQTVGSSGLLGSTMSTLFTSLDIRASSPGHSGTSICVLFICLPLGGILDSVLQPVVALLGVVLNGVGGIVDAVLDPLLQALGIKLGTATVTMTAVSVDQPQIVSLEPSPETE